ncbi:sporulation protein YqfD [Salibacterium salarium]|uniref:Sporulation protein YqfD n=2 Tax=Salibacterium salarium TaxID=284579 RepID=A0A428N7X7_9BACI|nr:sporulation protein YqfD [Salibacterium salarium]
MTKEGNMKKRRELTDVKVRVTGKHIENIINYCLRDGIILSNVTRQKGAVEFYTTQSNVNEIQEATRLYDCEWEMIEESTYQKYYGYLKTRTGFFLGVSLFILIIILLSQMIWKIEIEGADPRLEYEMKDYLDELGIKVGAFQFLLPDSEGMQTQLLNKMDEVTWIGVNKKGTTYQFQVVEQSLPEKSESQSPHHLVAKKTAVINSIYAEKGKPMVKQNDVVHKNDVLISGFIGEGEYSRAVAAQGEVRGETWYKVTVELPEKLLLQTLTGESEKSYTIQLFGLNIPIWGMNAGEQYDNVVVSEKTHDAKVWKWNLPVSLEVNKYQESKTVQDVSKKNIMEKSKEAATITLKNRLSNNAEIKAEKILHEDSQNGKVRLVIHYQVIEDIISEAPIIQGE